MKQFHFLWFISQDLPRWQVGQQSYIEVSSDGKLIIRWKGKEKSQVFPNLHIISTRKMIPKGSVNRPKSTWLTTKVKKKNKTQTYPKTTYLKYIWKYKKYYKHTAQINHFKVDTYFFPKLMKLLSIVFLKRNFTLEKGCSLMNVALSNENNTSTHGEE